MLTKQPNMFQGKDIVVVIGVERSGKTTLATGLQQKLGYRYYTEIAQQYRKKAKCLVYDSCPVFDELVMVKEFERDGEIQLDNPMLERIVFEQWHFGNIAFARLRSPEVAEQYLQRIKWLKRKLPKLNVILLEISLETMIKRIQNESRVELDLGRLKSFYASWVREMEYVLEQLGLQAFRIDAEQSRQSVLDVAANYLTLGKQEQNS